MPAYPACANMIELTKSGLPLRWDETGKKLDFGPGMKEIEPALRNLGEMKDVLYSEAALDRDPALPLYYMYRDVHLAEHRSFFREAGIRYDITVLVPGMLEREYVKTAGHYHPFKEGTGCTYPEVYEVLQGEAHYLLQKPRNFDDPAAGLDEVLVVAAGPGDKVLIPPGFGHITINPGSGFLVMSNLVADNFDSIYGPIKEMGGAGYYEVAPAGKEQGPVFIPNVRYPSLPPLCFTEPVELPNFFLIKEIPQYRSFVEHREDFDFLTSPEYYEEEFSSYLQDLKSGFLQI